MPKLPELPGLPTEETERTRIQPRSTVPEETTGDGEGEDVEVEG